MRNLLRLLIGAVAIAGAATAVSAQNNWTIPAGGDAETNPTAVNDAMVQKGRSLFMSNCARCHGETGVGDGPDGDARALPADLTDPFRAPLNPDGTLFYKIWNGKGREMPAFKSQMTKDDVWAVVEYIKTLRNPSNSGSR